MARTFRGYSTEVWDNPKQAGEPGTFAYSIKKTKKESKAYPDALNHYNWNNGTLTDAEYVAYLTERLGEAEEGDTEVFTILNKLQQVFNAREQAHFSAIGITEKDRLAFAQQKSTLMQAYLEASQSGDEAGAAAILKKIDKRDGSINANDLKDYNEVKKLGYDAVKAEITNARAENDLLLAEGKITAMDHLTRKSEILTGAREMAKEYGVPTQAIDLDIAQAKRKADEQNFTDAKTIALSHVSYMVSTGQMDPVTKLQIEQQWIKNEIAMGNKYKMSPAEIAKLEASYADKEKSILDTRVADAFSAYKDEELSLEYDWKLGNIGEEEYVARRSAMLEAIQADTGLAQADPQKYNALVVGAITAVQSANSALTNRRLALSRSEVRNALSTLDLQTKDNPIVALAVADEKLRLIEAELVGYQNQLDALAGSTDPDAAAQRNNLQADIEKATRDRRDIKLTLDSPTKTAVYNAATQEYTLQATSNVTGKGITRPITLPDGTTLNLFFKAEAFQVRNATLNTTTKAIEIDYQTQYVVNIPVGKDNTGNIITRKAILDPTNESRYFFIDGASTADVQKIVDQVYTETKVMDANGNPLRGSSKTVYDSNQIVTQYLEAKFKTGTEDEWRKAGVLVSGTPLEVRTVSPYVPPPTSNPARMIAIPAGMRTMAPAPENTYRGAAKTVYATVENAYGATTWDNWLKKIGGPRMTQQYGTSTRTGVYATGSGMWQRGIHGGYDLALAVGTPLPSLVGGKVVQTQMNNSGWGGTVVVQMANGYTVRFAHMSKVNVKTGDTVAPGQVLGLSGNTGNSTGPHLHVEMKSTSSTTIDPGMVLKDSTSITKNLQPVSPEARAAMTQMQSSPLAQREDVDFGMATKIDAHLQGRGSPMAGQGATFVAIGRQYGIDPLFLVAITGADSSYGKNLKTPFNPGNVLNWPGHSTAFGSWREGIEAIAKYAINGTYMKNLNTVGEIANKYTPDAIWRTNTKTIYAQLKGSPVTDATTFRTPIGSSYIGASSASVGIPLEPVQPVDIGQLFQRYFYKQPTKEDITAWQSSGLDVAGMEHRLQQYQEAKTKRIIALGLQQWGAPVEAGMVNRIYDGERDRIERGEQPVFGQYIGTQIDKTMRAALGFPETGALSVEQQAQLNAYRAENPTRFIYETSELWPEAVTPEAPGASIAPSDIPTTPGQTYIGPNGETLSYEDLIGEQGAGDVLTTEPDFGPPIEGAELANLQRTYMVQTNDTELKSFGAYLDAYRSGATEAPLPDGGRMQTEAETKSMDFQSTINTFVGGEYAGNASQSGNFADYARALVQQGLSEDVALQRAKDLWKKDATLFNNRVAVTPEKQYTPSIPDRSAISSIKNA